MHCFCFIINISLFLYATAKPLSNSVRPNVTSVLSASDSINAIDGDQLSASIPDGADTFLTNETATGPIHCNRGMIMARWTALELCLTAVDHLPHWADTGEFHQGSSTIGDRFSLDGRPVTSESCEILVTIPQRGQVVRSSWSRIRAVAVDVATECRVTQTRDPALTRGGYVMEGEPEGIRIEVRKKVIRPVE